MEHVLLLLSLIFGSMMTLMLVCIAITAFGLTSKNANAKSFEIHLSKHKWFKIEYK